MALKPILKSKVDELFLRWLSETETQQLLRENLRQILQGEHPTQPSPRQAAPPASGLRPQSPRIPGAGGGSLPTNRLPSPRSPRRPLATKNNHRNHNGSTKPGVTVAREKERPDNNNQRVLRDWEEREKDKEREKEKHRNQVAPAAVPTPTATVTASVVLPRPGGEEQENRPRRRDLPQPRPRSGPAPFPVPQADVPPFHFPTGRPPTPAQQEAVLSRVGQEFSKMEGGRCQKKDMGRIAKALGLPLYWKCPLWKSAGGEKQGHITLQQFTAMWKRVTASHHDAASQFVRLVAKPNNTCLEEDDFVPLMQDIVEYHPGLTFLQEAPEFHSRYVNTVIARIFFCVNRSWTGKITIPELRKSNFLQILATLEEEDDINQVTEYFSYEHFYVIYCKFWELDKDHDLFIDRHDLARHNDHAISSRMIDRIFSGAVTRGRSLRDDKMSYPEFVWFLIAEEDKRHPTSIEYWFRCMDLDGDGVISMYEMNYFYDEQMQKMEAIGIEKLPFEDCLCQMLDLVGPKEEGKITLRDLKTCKMANIFFDTFFNLDKFLEHEQRDPFANVRDPEAEGTEMSDWDRYAAEEYDILVAEEGANDQEEIHYDDDFEVDDDDSLANEMVRLSVASPTSPTSTSPKDDIYDFNTKDLGY